MLKILNLESGYGSLRVLKSISIHVSPEEIVTIIGANGAGKSTLLGTVSGLIKPSAGQIVFEGTDITTCAPEKIVKAGCSLVPERRQLFGTLTVSENLTLGAYLRLRSARRREVASTLEDVYSLFPVLAERQKQLAGTLSGGEQQMVAIGRALMSQPKLLMMDEPSLGIAPIVVREIFRTIVKLKDRGVTILLVEQNARASLSIASRGYVLETGQIFMEGSSRELLDNHDVQRAYLGKDYKKINE